MFVFEFAPRFLLFATPRDCFGFVKKEKKSSLIAVQKKEGPSSNGKAGFETRPPNSTLMEACGLEGRPRALPFTCTYIFKEAIHFLSAATWDG